MSRPRVPILYVHHRPELGGAPQSLSNLIGTIDRSRWEPHVYCPGGPAADLFTAAGAEVHVGPVAAFTHIWASTYAGRRWLLLLRELANLPRHVLAFRRVLRSRPFVLVHLNDSPLVAAAWLARRHRVPVVWHLRSALPASGPRRSAFLRRTISRLASASVAINDDVAASFDVGAVTIPNTVDLERFAPARGDEARDALGLPAELPVVSFFGFVYPSKGFWELIRAAALLRDRGIDAHYLIVGGAVRGAAFFRSPGGRILRLLGLAQDYAGEANELVARLGLGDRVRFVPFTRDTPALYRASDVVVAPSRGPELGRPVLEASACGRPVIASGSLDGAGIVLPGETGLLVPRRSPDTLAAAMNELLADPALRARLGASARIHAEENFEGQRNARLVMDVYERALA